MKKLFLTVLLLCLILRPSFGQVDSTKLWQKAIFDSTANFSNIYYQQAAYFKLHPDQATEEDGTFSDFKRWAEFWSTRVDRSNGGVGGIQNAVKRYEKVFDKLNEYTSVPDPSLDWSYVGPKRLSTQNYGIVTCVKIDPGDMMHQTFYAGTGASGLWKTSDGGRSWANLTGINLSSGMGIMDMAINPNNSKIIYITTYAGGLNRNFAYGRGIMRSTDGGFSWTYVLKFYPSQQKPLTKILMDPANPNRLVAFGQNYIYKTLDGTTWSEVPIPSGVQFCYDNNLNWVVPKAVRSVVFKPGSNNNSVYVGTDFADIYNAELWEIDDIYSNNVTFIDLTANHSPSGPYQRFTINIKKGSADTVFMGGLTYNGAFNIWYVLPQTTTLKSWGSVNTSEDLNQGQCEFKMSESIPNTFILCGHFFTYYQCNKQSGSISSLQKIDDQHSDNNQDQIYHTDTRSLDYFMFSDQTKSMELILVGNDGGVTRAIRSGSDLFTFNNINGSGLYITQFNGLGVCRDSADYTVAGTQDNKLMLFNYTPHTWTIDRVGTGDAYDNVIHPTNPKKVFAISGGGATSSFLLRTLDGFNSNPTTPTINSLSNDNCINNFKPIVLNPNNPDTALIGFQDIYRSTDAWNQNSCTFNAILDRTNYYSCHDTLAQNDDLCDIAVAPSNDNWVYAAYRSQEWYGSSHPNYLIKSTNATASTPSWKVIPNSRIFQTSNNQSLCTITHIAIAPDDPKTIWLTFGNFSPWWVHGGFRVVQSSDSGHTFTDLISYIPYGSPDTLPNLPVNCIKVLG